MFDREKRRGSRVFFSFPFLDENTFTLVKREKISCADEDLKLGAKLKVKTSHGAKVYMGHLLNFGKFPS